VAAAAVIASPGVNVGPHIHTDMSTPARGCAPRLPPRLTQTAGRHANQRTKSPHGTAGPGFERPMVNESAVELDARRSSNTHTGTQDSVDCPERAGHLRSGREPTRRESARSGQVQAQSGVFEILWPPTSARPA